MDRIADAFVGCFIKTALGLSQLSYLFAAGFWLRFCKVLHINVAADFALGTVERLLVVVLSETVCVFRFVNVDEERWSDFSVGLS